MTTSELPSPRRQRSRQHLLEIIRRENGVTRADLILLTGLSRSAIAEAVQDLLSDRLITEDVLDAGGKGAGRGRPSALLMPATAGGTVVGIDFDHDHVAVAIADTEGRVGAEQWTAVDVDARADAALDVASGMVRHLLSQANLSITDVRSVAAGIPAALDVRSKRIHSSSVLSGWVGMDPEQELFSRLGRPVSVANDADLGAQGELRFGAARGARDFLYIKASEGIGAGLVLNGATYRGSMGIAGEIGHTRLNDQGNWCRCGNRGCLETVISSVLVRERMRELRVADGADPNFPLSQANTHPVAARFVTETGRTLGRVLADLCNALNPALIVLGGELGTAGGALVDGVRESINYYAQPATAQSLDIRSAHLGLRSELLGAVAHATQQALYLA